MTSAHITPSAARNAPPFTLETARAKVKAAGNEHWEFDEEGLMRRRDMSGNDYPIEESERRYRQR